MKKSILFLTFFVNVQLCVFAQPTPSLNAKKVLRYHTDSTLHLISAHRGGRYLANYPENALETIAFTLEKIPNAVIEFDVSMTRDSHLVLLHDKSLDRTTIGTGMIKEKTWAEIKDLNLKDDFGTVCQNKFRRYEKHFST